MKSKLEINCLEFNLNHYSFKIFGTKAFTYIFYFTDPSGIYLIERLKPLKIYLVRARSRNLAGLSEPSNIVYLQTNRTFKPLGRGGRGYPYQVRILIYCFLTSSVLYKYHSTSTFYQYDNQRFHYFYRLKT